MSVDPGSQAGGHQGGSTPVFLQANSPVGSAHTSCPLILRQIVRSENGGVDSSIRHDSVVSSDVNHVLKSSMSPVYLPAGKTKMLHFCSSTLKNFPFLFLVRNKCFIDI